MKLELRENMYYRTYSGSINKITSIKDFNEREYLLNGFYTNKDTIKKASYNIIDLIEVGDFLDNHCIIEIKDNTCYLNDGWFISGDDIENLVYSICTHEMFERGCFEI